DKNRLRTFLALTQYDELCACQITELLQITGATASRHLGILVNAGLVKSRKKSRWVYFSLDESRTDIDGILDWLLPRLQESGQMQTDLTVLKRIMAIAKEDLCRIQRGEACCPVQKKETADG
ncbi:MAG: metalloregulator ArsR/SmtB family transcription factor, partial [Desulfobacteraceae bacterium]|nr:metalloregulator ArsR/SmtB family transcription factor [Desulfobacteraceae bacterium]